VCALSRELEQDFDVIVVGAGTAGCALAARLSEDARCRVCLLEAGGGGRSPFVAIPAALVIAQRNRAINWGFRTVPQRELDGRCIPVPRGRGVGGSALINGMVYFRGHPRDYDDWSRAGASGWSYTEVLPYFCRSEHNENFGPSALHARGGPMNVRTVTHPNELNFAFLEAAAEAGIPVRDDLMGADTEGAALRQLCIRDGTRETSARALLRPALARRNLRVLTRARALRLIIERSRAQAVEIALGQDVLRVRATRDIVLCAGAIHSPQLLMLSGVGDPRHLGDMGIDVRHALEGVGRNLHDHLASPVHMASASAASYGISWRALPRDLLQLAQYAVARSGPLANNIFESAAFVRTDPRADRPDVQLVFQPAKRPGPSFPFPLGHGFAISPVGLYPRSRGRILLSSADPAAPPLIDPQLLSAPEDLQPLLRGMRLARRILHSGAFARYRAREIAPGEAAGDSDASLAAYVRAQAYTVHHPVSTCRMGGDALAVVDPQLRVRGLEGLRVADAAVFPSIIGGNTNAAVVMIAEKAADLILGRPPLPPAQL